VRTYLSLWKGVQPWPRTLCELATEAAEAAGLTLADLRSRNQHKRFSEARQAFMYAAHEQRLHSLGQIATFIHRLDHTTVLYGVRQHKLRMVRNASPL